ncbi:DUF58 domain-containing protein [bacterium]|nr:DUF58 domain-containing protein [bacterium]
MLPERASRSFLDPAVLGRLSAVPLVARRPMQGTVSKRHASPHRGSSVEFAEYRKYVPGDDLRRLDWRAYGRSDRFYIKEFEADTNLRLCLVLDTSGSMGYGSVGIDKISYARKLAGTLAYLAGQQGDAVGLACVAGGIVQQIPPRQNPAHLRVVFDLLEQASPQGKTGLVDVLHQLAETIRTRAMVVVLSDIFVEPALLLECFQHLRFRRYDVSVLHLLDPLEMSFAFRRPTRFVDMEGGSSLFVEPSDVADRYEKALAKYLADLWQVVLESAIDYDRVLLDEDYERVLLRFLTRRMQAREHR